MTRLIVWNFSRLCSFDFFASHFSAPVISITEAGRDGAENGRELHSDSKVKSKIEIQGFFAQGKHKANFV